MKTKNPSPLLVVIAFVLVFVSACNGQPSPQNNEQKAVSQEGNKPVLISKTTAGLPIDAGNFVVWVDTREGGQSLFGYDVAGAKEFKIAGPTDAIYEWRSDGKYVVWMENVLTSNSPLTRLRSYSLTTSATQTLDEDTSQIMGNLRINHGAVYYQTIKNKRRGLFSVNLQNKQQEFITSTVRFNYTIVGDNMVWEGGESGAGGSILTSTLLIANMNSLDKSRVIVSVSNCSLIYDASVSEIVYGFSGCTGQNPGVYSYNWKDETKVRLSETELHSVHADGSSVVWISSVKNGDGKAKGDEKTIHAYNPMAGSRIVATYVGSHNIEGLTSSSAGWIAFVMFDGGAQESLYLIQFNKTYYIQELGSGNQPNAVENTCPPNPNSHGHVSVSGSGHLSEAELCEASKAFGLTNYVFAATEALKPASRAEVALVLVKARGYTIYDPPEPTYNDVAETSSIYKETETLVLHHVLDETPCSSGVGICFRPDDLITRAEFSEMVYQAFGE